MVAPRGAGDRGGRPAILLTSNLGEAVNVGQKVAVLVNLVDVDPCGTTLDIGTVVPAGFTVKSRRYPVGHFAHGAVTH